LIFDSINNILGSNIKREELTGIIHLSQEKYIRELLEKFYVTEATMVSILIGPNVKITKKMVHYQKRKDGKCRNHIKNLLGQINLSD